MTSSSASNFLLIIPTSVWSCRFSSLVTNVPDDISDRYVASTTFSTMVLIDCSMTVRRWFIVAVIDAILSSFAFSTFWIAADIISSRLSDGSVRTVAVAGFDAGEVFESSGGNASSLIV